MLAAGTARELVSGLMDTIERFCYAARHHPIFRARVADWVSFKEPKKTDFQHLVPFESENRGGHKRAHRATLPNAAVAMDSP